MMSKSKRGVIALLVGIGGALGVALGSLLINGSGPPDLRAVLVTFIVAFAIAWLASQPRRT